MALRTETAHSLAGIVARGDAACQEALERGEAVDLVVPDRTWRDCRKLQLSRRIPAGVHVQDYDEWLEGLWELYGDGRRPVSSLQRRAILRPLITGAGLLKGEPSAKLVAQFAAFAAEALVPLSEPAEEELGAVQEKVMGVVSAYGRRLAELGLVEQVQMEAALAKVVLAGHALVLEKVDLKSPHRRRFVRALGERLTVTEVVQELAIGSAGAWDTADDATAGAARTQTAELVGLRKTLYTGEGGLEPTGAVVAAEAWGAHAADALLCELVGRFLAEGEAPGEIAIVFPDVAESYPHAQEALARAGVPFKARFSLPVSRTPLGAAFCALMGLKGALKKWDWLVFPSGPCWEKVPVPDFCSAPPKDTPDDPASYERLAGLLTTPYAGIDGRDARALQMRWRERAGSTPQERWQDITEGFAQGNATAAKTKERLLPLAELLAAGHRESLALMLSHAQGAFADENALVDDRAAAKAILGYLSACEKAGTEPRVEDLAGVPVPLERASGDPENAVLLSDAASLALVPMGRLIVADLDVRHYPMARQAGPFDALAEKLGIARPDDMVIEQRVKLLNLVEGAERGVAFCRATHDTQGNESVQSALWDELMTAYRSAPDEDEGRAIQEVPAALEPFALRLSEAGLFAREKERIASVREVRRGRLANEEEVELLTHDLSGRETPFSPTGIEDYYRCPYRWFACRRVGYNGMDNEFDAAAQGNLAHATMERFYRELKRTGAERVTPENLEAALGLLSRALDEQVEHDEGRNRGGLFLRTEQDRYLVEEIREMLLGLVRRDADFLPGYVPTYFELTLGKGTGTMLEYGGVPVRGKVDRIDVDAQGNAVIIDYKLSGLASGYGLAPERDVPGRIQTDIYATLVQRHFDLLGVPLRVVGSVYRSYSKNCLRGVYARSIDWGPVEQVFEQKDGLPRPGHAESYDEYLDLVEETVRACMERLRAGHIEPDPLDGDAKGVCEYCKALAFCPRGEA